MFEKEIIAGLAALLAVFGNVPYMRAVVRGEVRPHPYTWFIGSIVSCTVFFGQVVKGAGIGALPTAAAELFTIGIFLLSLKYGFKGIRRSDHVLLAVALLGLVPWYVTHDPTWSVIIAVSIDVVSFIPTFRKTWHEPRSEHQMLFSMNVLRHALMLLSLEAYNVATTLHSVVMIVVNLGMVALVRRGYW